MIWGGVGGNGFRGLAGLRGLVVYPGWEGQWAKNSWIGMAGGVGEHSPGIGVSGWAFTAPGLHSDHGHTFGKSD